MLNQSTPGVRFGEEMVGDVRRDFVERLQHKVAPFEVSESPRETRTAPHEAKEQTAIASGTLLEHFPEPLDKRLVRIEALVDRDRLQYCHVDVWTSAYL